MNFKYAISLGALVALTGTSCWGAANNPFHQKRKISSEEDTPEEDTPPAKKPRLQTQAEANNNLFSGVTGGRLFQVTRALTKEKADVNAVNDEGNTPLMLATCTGTKKDLEVVDELLAHGANVNATNINNKTPLLFAASCHLRPMAKNMVTKLLEKGADINATDNFGNSALSFAAMAGNEKVVAILLENGANIGLPGQKAMRNAAKNGQRHIVRQLMQAGVDSNAALKQAIDNNSRITIKVLLEEGAENSNLSDTQLATLAYWGLISGG